MKRTVVCMLLALSVSSSLYSSQIVLAAEQSEETLKEHSNEGASENMDNIKDEQSSITSTEAVPNEEETTKPEEQVSFNIKVNENLDVLRQKIKNPFKEEVSSGRYLLNEDLIFIGYVDSTKGEEGFITLLWSSIFVTLMANKIGGLQFGIYRNCQISSRVFHTAVAALPLTKANRSDFE